MRNRSASRKGKVLLGRARNPLARGAEVHGGGKVWCVTAGVPCQDVSIAGRRAGLAGTRTGLFHEFARILREVRPAWFIFENVPGLLSSNQGRDFAEVLRVLMVECGYGLAWRVLDSRYFGVAQRRQRVFIVGRFGEPCPAEILFEREGSQGDSAAGRQARQDIAVPLTSGVGVSGNAPGRRMEDDFNLALFAPPLRTGGNSHADDHNIVSQEIFRMRGFGDYEASASASAAKQRDYKDATDLVVASALRESDGHHGRSSPRGDGCDNLVAFDPFNHTLDNVSATIRVSPGGQQAAFVAATIGANPNGGYKPEPGAGIVAIQDVRGGTRDKTEHGQGIGISETETMYTLSKTEQHAVAFLQSSEYGVKEYDQAGALRADRQSCGEYAIFSVAENQRGEIRTSEISSQLSTGGGKLGSGYSAVAYGTVANALDASRGGPDDNSAQGNHLVPHAGREERTMQFGGDEGENGQHHGTADHERAAADADRVRDFAGLPKGMDSPRYRALGNAVTVSVIEWIGKRIIAWEEAQEKA